MTARGQWARGRIWKARDRKLRPLIFARRHGPRDARGGWPCDSSEERRKVHARRREEGGAENGGTATLARRKIFRGKIFATECHHIPAANRRHACTLATAACNRLARHVCLAGINRRFAVPVRLGASSHSSEPLNRTAPASNAGHPLLGPPPSPNFLFLDILPGWRFCRHQSLHVLYSCTVVCTTYLVCGSRR